MLILHVGDGHLTGKNPIARVDDIVEVQFNKWKEIVQIANKFNCPIITPGDILNVPIIANSILTRFGSILQALEHPIFFTWGNHDLMYHSLDMWNRTSLGVLWSNSPKVKHISQFQRDYGIAWDYIDWNQELVSHDSPFLLTHKAVVYTKQIGKNSWILDDPDFAFNIDDEKFLENYKLIICGHWHRQYQFKRKNTTVINAGVILRRTIEEKDIPCVNLINLDNMLRTKIKLKSAKPTSEVISKKHLNEKIHIVQHDIKQFVDSLRNTKIKNSAKFLDNLMNLLDNHELDPAIENILRQMVAQVMEKKGGQ
jgi:DNA repair exonuclease SbcCD nuclease subunit